MQIISPISPLSRLRRFVDSFFGAVLGAGVFAAWAAFANWDTDNHGAVRAALTQWVISILVTYYGFMVMRWCFGSAQPVMGAVRAFVGGLVATYALAFGLHVLFGTPRIALTLSAGVLPNVLVDASYALLLMRTHLLEKGLV